MMYTPDGVSSLNGDGDEAEECPSGVAVAI